jgi:hypothetical protein
MLSSCLKLALDLLATITLRVIHFFMYALFPMLLPLFECNLKVASCESVQHCLWFLSQSPQLCQNNFLGALSSTKGKRENLQGSSQANRMSGGPTVMLFLVKIPWWKGSMERCIIMQQPVILSAIFRVKFSHIFMQSP